MKAYIGKIVTEENHLGLGSWIHLDFNSKIEGAGFWATRQEAENDAVRFENHDIRITTTEGHRHRLQGYRVEERTPEEFVIWVDAPFIPFTGTDKPDSAA